MCGIAGFVPRNFVSNPERTLNAMLTRIQHRGPDECGTYLSDRLCMGNVRLSIVDLASGQQPLSTQDGRYWIAYNGEVFNYLELKRDLEIKGHTFKTNCDTEIVVHMYQEYGSECLQHLNGQFAFSIWDEVKDELFLARDRMGIRPLFYSYQKENFVFGSEIKSIFEFPEINRALNHRGLQQVFTFWTTLTPQTIFEDVYELPPGHYAIFNRDKSLTIHRYWDLKYEKNNSLTIETAKNQFQSLFEDSIKLRMRADVPVAAYLSGGLDSTSTTAFIKKMFPEALNTFSIGFEEQDFDETIFQKEVADHLDTRHHSVIFKNDDVIDLFYDVIWHTEIPVLRSAPFPMYKLSKLVRDNDIKVVITGEGADEMLGGYNVFKEAIIRHFWSKYPDSKIRPMLLKKLYPYLPQLQGAGNSMLKLFFGYKLLETDSPIYSHLLRWNNTSRIANHFSEDLRKTLNGKDIVRKYEESVIEKIKNYSPLSKAQYIESTVFMSGYLLSSQGDRMAMGNSVEGRYPFLDHRIIEFCASLPDDFKLNGLNEKYLLKEVVKNVIPQSVLKRPKQAYRAPIAQALLNNKNGFVDDTLASSAIKSFGVFNEKSIAGLITKMRKTPNISEIDNMALMGILSTQILYKQYIEEFRYLKDEEIRKGVVRN
ncbi:asparagine synthase (glutamine-hydrolyzing) [Plebeiibacterium sediminum]|uniref:asparagine synthase (glutamine-hydrolyzing) n=1 Tax=Plebeiibacterium sediminum TaxID=2992112 RepID=A0AAE3SEB2_9BACT|nr:asparagine synthase (glutamine-hydrolyzing) [Plebeiobacterium sediminum]MCW3786225.1 asparagine synthase (glutamine-hydrolyzing) [Plebeiobacterium sediminum]